MVNENAKNGVRDAIQSVALQLDEIRLLTLLDSENSPTLAEAIATLYSSADSIADGADVGSHMLAIVGAWRSAINEYGDSARTLKTMRSIGLGLTRPAVVTTYDQGSVNSILVYDLFRRSFGLLQGEFAARASYKTREAATVELSSFGSWADAEATRIEAGGTAEVYDAFDRARAKITDLFVRASTDLKPAIKLTLPALTPSLVLATQLYADPTRAEEIWAASGSGHPSFVGPYLEVPIE